MNIDIRKNTIKTLQIWGTVSMSTLNSHFRMLKCEYDGRAEVLAMIRDGVIIWGDHDFLTLADQS